MNLLEETIEDIKESGHAIEDIVFIGSEESGHECSWDQFAIMANREYDSGVGAANVAQDLVIVFSDGAILTRGEYDGSEWWEYSKKFKRPEEAHPIATLFSDGHIGWVDLEEVNPVPESA